MFLRRTGRQEVGQHEGICASVQQVLEDRHILLFRGALLSGLDYVVISRNVGGLDKRDALVDECLDGCWSEFHFV